MIRTALCFSYSPAKLQKHYGKGRHGYHPSNLHQKWKTITLLQFSTAPLAVPVMVSDWDAIWLLVWCNLHSLQACLVKWGCNAVFWIVLSLCLRFPPAVPCRSRTSSWRRARPTRRRRTRPRTLCCCGARWRPLGTEGPLGPDQWALITSTGPRSLSTDHLLHTVCYTDTQSHIDWCYSLIHSFTHSLIHDLGSVPFTVFESS